MEQQNVLAVKYLGRSLIFLIVSFTLCFLAVLGYNTYVKLSGQEKRIEVQANSNSSVND